MLKHTRNCVYHVSQVGKTSDSWQIVAEKLIYFISWLQHYLFYKLKSNREKICDSYFPNILMNNCQKYTKRKETPKFSISFKLKWVKEKTWWVTRSRRERWYNDINIFSYFVRDDHNLYSLWSKCCLCKCCSFSVNGFNQDLFIRCSLPSSYYVSANCLRLLYKHESAFHFHFFHP